MKQYIRYFLFRMLVGLCNILPQRFLYFIALRLADMNFYWLDPSGRRAVLDNLRHVLPDAPESRILKEGRWVFRNFGKYLTEFFRFRHFDLAYFKTNMAVMGIEHVEAALAKGKGCIALSAHVANWEMGVAGLSIMGGKKVTVVAAMHRYGRINNLFMRERESVGLTVVDMEKDAARKLMRALKRNEVVGMMGDRDPTEQGIEINFFGRPCRFPQGPARIAIATGAPIVPAFCLRRTNDSFTTIYLKPLEPKTDGDKEERARDLTQRFAHIIEQTIRTHPEQWAVFYPFWEANWRPE